ncbi:hypothetical protein KOW79_005877 [Hemibagrus wyckioides]|uniref:MAP3K HisK-N-like globin domain-containing protein n=1 Tax=Hemibagrus wyckioides TaxID=337641 RepID=A0A9D3SUL8_9TELE|nr:hypothetical protein KOW79_005877 [Hemibagrus wyckioides]
MRSISLPVPVVVEDTSSSSESDSVSPDNELSTNPSTSSPVSSALVRERSRSSLALPQGAEETKLKQEHIYTLVASLGDFVRVADRKIIANTLSQLKLELDFDSVCHQPAAGGAVRVPGRDEQSAAESQYQTSLDVRSG